MDRLGCWQEVLKTHLFDRNDARAEDLFQRMFAGFLHPIIQLLYGVEFDQPAVVAEGLAQAAVHSNRLDKFLIKAEKKGDERRKDQSYRMPAILELMREVGENEKLRVSAEWKDDNKIYDGVLVRAPEEAIELASKVVIRPEELDERTAEMFHAAIYVASGAAVREGKEPRVDFYLM
jgi:questin oxidase-like protein